MQTDASAAATPINRPVALYADALALWDAGRPGEAADRLDEALRLRPNFAEALSMGAYILQQGGKSEAAVRFYQRALECKPDQPIAWSNLGKLLYKLGQFEAALAAFDAGARLRPFEADFHSNRASALRSLGRLEDSERAAREALQRRPNFPEAALNLGAALLKLGRHAEALAAFRRAGELRADYADALCGEALALRGLDRLDEARAAFAAAEALGSREAISGRGCLDLLLGDFGPGWEGYEARWISGKSLADALGMRFPTWKGPGRAGERVLVLNDHGLGDTIQFARYLALMREAGVEATFVCPSKLHRLLGGQCGARLLEAPPADERFDAQIALSSLPRAFATRIDSVPARVPYLYPEPHRQRLWADRIGEAGFKIGVVWQGNPNPEADMARSFPLQRLAPLAATPGVRLISLQKGFGVEQIEPAKGLFPIENPGEAFDAGPDAFLDAAALIAHVDLVVTCDTSIAHLAGALGRPVWVALKKDAEWRWLRTRADLPWYPTMRLFRQPVAGDWATVFAEMAEALRLPSARAP